jgi:outer membrane protein assembly factor BamB
MDRSYREGAEVARRVFIGTNCHVACVDAETGATLWQQQIKTSMSSTLVTLLHYKDLLFAGCWQAAACLSVEGELRWTTKVQGLGEPVTLALDPGVPGGQLILGGGGKLFALSADEGKLLWTNELPGLGYHPLCLRAPGMITTTSVSHRQGKVMVEIENEQVG